MTMKRCQICGEKYSDTYRDCPFCEEEEALLEGDEELTQEKLDEMIAWYAEVEEWAAQVKAGLAVDEK